MGRDRLRRGCSLEVIFEEESDFCSNLDSLDPLPHFRRANRGDSYSIDTFFSEHSSNYPHLERPTLDRNTVFKSLDGYLDFRDMDSSFVEWDEFSGESSLRSDRTLSFLSQEHMSDSSPSILSGRRSRVSRRQIVEASWVMDEEHDSTTPTIESFDDEPEVGRFEGKHLDFDLDVDVEDSSALLTEETYAAVDQFDEQHSFSVPLIPSGTTTRNNNTRPGPCHAPTNKFSWNSSRDGSLKSGESPSYANFPPGNSHQTSKEDNNSSGGGMGHVSSSTDVKRVRAIFENSSASSSEDETNFSRKFNKANNASCKRLKESNSNSNSLASSGNPSMRSAYSHLSLNQMDRSDFADLLVNDKVIIEDSPDIYQMFRQHRHRDNLGGPGSKVSSSSSPFSRNSTLRRSKSVGAGIHQMNEDENMISINNPSSSTEDMNGKDRPCILAEEMPAPDTVKNVRTVFEQMYQKSRTGGNRANSQESSVPSNHINNNKSLSSIRSNPTSKILRSESMRTDFNGRGDSVVNTKPIILATTLKKTQEISKVFESKTTAKVQAQVVKSSTTTTTTIPKTKGTNGLSKVWPSVNVVNASQRQKPPPPIHEATEEESNSLHSLASSTTADDLEDRKQISPDVLNRIRSCGTTTTYFGGEIVAKTIQNRKLHVAPRKNSREEVSLLHHHEFEISSSETLFPTDEIFFSARPNQSTTPEKSRTSPNPPTPTPRRPFDLQFNSLITSSTVDTTPRIISVLPKSQSNSPTKSNSPVGSLMEGRNSPEGCESQEREWINDPAAAADVGEEMSPDIMKPEDSNNNSIKHGDHVKSNKFSQAAEGAWF